MRSISFTKYDGTKLFLYENRVKQIGKIENTSPEDLNFMSEEIKNLKPQTRISFDSDSFGDIHIKESTVEAHDAIAKFNAE